MLSLQPEQCAEPQPSSPQCHSDISVPMLAAAGTARARSQSQGQLGTSVQPQDVSLELQDMAMEQQDLSLELQNVSLELQDMTMEQQKQLLVEPWPHSCGTVGKYQEPSQIQLPAWALKLCDMLFVCK